MIELMVNAIFWSLRFCEVKMGMNAAERAPSTISWNIMSGIWNATQNASSACCEVVVSKKSEISNRFTSNPERAEIILVVVMMLAAERIEVWRCSSHLPLVVSWRSLGSLNVTWLL